MAKKTTQRPPDSAEREYVRSALRFARALARDSDRVLVPLVPHIKAQFDAETRSDAALDTLDAAIVELGSLATAHMTGVMQQLPLIMSMVNRHNAREFAAVFRANTGRALPEAVGNSVLGVNVFRSEPYLQPLADSWLKTNTDLIKSLPTRLHPELEGIVRRGVTSGASVKTIQRQLKDRYPITESRAKLIAQDQTLKLNADLTQFRLKSVGVEEYVWRSVGDSRVRPEHVEHNGRTYRWDDPPQGGNPGQPVRCRCSAEGVWPD